MTNEHNINDLIGKQITYRTAKSGHKMKYIIKKMQKALLDLMHLEELSQEKREELNND